MFSNLSRSGLLGGWMVLLGTVVAASIAMDAKTSTIVLLFAIGGALPGIVMVFLARSAPPPTVAEMLQAVEMKDRR